MSGPPLNPFGDREPDPATKEAKLKEYQKHLAAGKEDFKRDYKADACPEEDVNRYTVQAIIGEGGFGAVYLAQKGDILYAIKRVEKALGRKHRTTMFLIEEKRIHYAINDIFVLSVFNKYKDKLNLYMIMEFACHGDLLLLAKAYDNCRMPEARVRQIMVQVAMGLAYVHSCNVIHRDLKPGNIVLCLGGRAKIADFGLASVIGPDLFKLIGTPAYMSPEQLSQQAYNDAADWYSYGVVLFRLVSGVFPYGDLRMEKTQMLAEINRGLIHPAFKKEGFSKELKSLITQLLQKNPADRIGVQAKGVDDVKKHAWFKSVGWYKVIAFRQQFELSEAEQGTRRRDDCSPDVFKNIGKHETDEYDEY